jgi:hypothetical protein
MPKMTTYKVCSIVGVLLLDNDGPELLRLDLCLKLSLTGLLKDHLS